MNIYWGYPSFCLFYTKARCAESEAMVPRVEAYLRAAGAPRREGREGRQEQWDGLVPFPWLQPKSSEKHWSQSLSSTFSYWEHTKKREIKKKITSLIFMDMYHFIFMTSANHIVIRFKHGLTMHTHQDGH